MTTHDQRVLVVYQHLPHYRLDVFRALQSLPGFRFTFAAGDTSADQNIRRLDARQLDDVRTLRNHWVKGALWQSGLARLLVRERWDAVIFLGDAKYLSTWAGSLAVRAQRIPVLFWTIGWHRPDTGLKRHARMAFYRLADHLLLYGNHARLWGAEAGYPPERMTTIYNSSAVGESTPDTGDLQRLEDALPPRGTPAIGAVIRLNPSKGLDQLIDVAAVLNERRTKPLHVVIAGDGPARQSLLDHARERNVVLHLTGSVYGEDQLGRIYDAVQVTVVPTLAGLSVLQSFRFGRPVVTHSDATQQVPEFEAIEPGSTGELSDYGDLNSMADAVERALTAVEKDPAGVAQRCRDAVANVWSAQNQAEQIRRALNSVRDRA